MILKGNLNECVCLAVSSSYANVEIHESFLDSFSVLGSLPSFGSFKSSAFVLDEGNMVSA